MYRRYCSGNTAYRPVYEERRPRPQVMNPLMSLLPRGMDLGDLLLYGVLLLLYMDTGDEEYLIMLLAVMM